MNVARSANGVLALSRERNAMADGIRVLWLLIPVMGLAGCYKSSFPPSQCENSDAQEVLSNDRQWKAVVFHRWCPEDRPAFHVSVLPAATPLPNEAGNAFRQDVSLERAGTGGHAHTIQQVWKGPRELWISHDENMKVAYSVSEVGEVTVVQTSGDILGH
jgi:hypothetical protein